MNIDKRILLSGVALALTAGWAGPSAAQSVKGALAEADENNSNFARDRNVSVRQRSPEGYEALGVRLGTFMAWPKVIVTAEHTDNLFASPAEIDDVLVRVQPEVRVTSTWSRHALDGYLRGSFNRYNDFSTEDTDEWAAGLSGQIDIQRTSNINLAVDYSHMAESRASSDTAQASIAPIEYDLISSSISGAKEFNRLRLSGGVDWREFDYDDGFDITNTPIEQDDRDRTVTVATARADYAVSPSTAFFVQVAGNKRDYKLGAPLVPAPRNSDGEEFLAGVNFEISALVRGEVGIGYVKQDYDNPIYKDVEGLGARAQVEWFPTELTTVSLTGTRSVEDSGIAGDAGYLASQAAVQVDHELLRNVVLTGRVSYAEDQRDGVTVRKDERLGASVGATYLVNRNVGVTVGYSYLDQDSTVASRNFKINKVSAGLTFQF